MLREINEKNPNPLFFKNINDQGEYIMKENKSARKCHRCGASIFACMGFVNAGDFLKAIEGVILFSEVRELCGKCVLILQK